MLVAGGLYELKIAVLVRAGVAALIAPRRERLQARRGAGADE